MVKNISLDAVVIGDHTEAPDLRISGGTAIDILPGASHRRCQIASEHAAHRTGFLDELLRIDICGTYDPAHGAFASDVQHKSAGIHLRNRHDAVSL